MTDRIELSACTSMMVGKNASIDGSTMISRMRIASMQSILNGSSYNQQFMIDMRHMFQNITA